MTGLPVPAPSQVRQTVIQKSVFFFYGLPLFFAPLSTAATSISIVVLLLAYVGSRYWQDWRLPFQRPWFWPLLILVVVTCLGMLWTEDSREGWRVLSKLKYSVLALVGATLPWNSQQLVRVIRLFLAGWTVNALIGFGRLGAAYLKLAPPLELGPTGLTGHGNVTLAMCFGLLWLAYDIKHRVVLPRRWNMGLSGLFFLQLILSGGRAGQLSFIVLFPLALLLLYAGRARFWAVAIACLTLVAVSFSPMVRARASRGIEDLKRFSVDYSQGRVSTSWGLRLVLWEGALRMAVDRPLLGVGTGDYETEMGRLERERHIPQRPRATYLNQPHSSYFAYLACLGVVGFIALMVFLFSLCYEAWGPRHHPPGWFKLCYLAVFLFGSLVNTLIWYHSYAVTLYLLAGIPAVVAVPGPGSRTLSEA